MIFNKAALEMFLSTVAIFGFAAAGLADQHLSVVWSDPKHTSINIAVSHHDEDMNACLKSGADVFYRFEIQVCTRRRSCLIAAPILG